MWNALWGGAAAGFAENPERLRSGAARLAVLEKGGRRSVAEWQREACSQRSDDGDAMLVQRKRQQVAEVTNKAKWRNGKIRTQVGVGVMWRG